jgi:hypothetical protein
MTLTPPRTTFNSSSLQLAAGTKTRCNLQPVRKLAAILQLPRKLAAICRRIVTAHIGEIDRSVRICHATGQETPSGACACRIPSMSTLGYPVLLVPTTREPYRSVGACPHRRIVTTHIGEIDHSHQICYTAGQETTSGARAR